MMNTKIKAPFNTINHSLIYDKYFEYFHNQGYTHDECKLIASVFEKSTHEAEPVCSFSVEEMKQKGSVSMACTGPTAIYCHDSQGKVVERHNISLESAILLNNQGVVMFEKCSRHFLEYYWLA